ncbi:MAG: serine/threonine protein kinase [Rubripirellula sp.]
MSPPFEFLGPYRIGKVIGRGGMGTVYSAVHEKTGEKVAVKLIAANVADEPRFRRRFDAEIKSLELLKHVGIVRIIGCGEEEGQLFYSMELVEGESLQARIRREKRMDWRPTLDVGIQVCAALKHAHDMGVIHRDLKPANLLMTSDDVVKLVDFGIAKIFGDSNTLAGSVLGTADYMAPEQATSEGITPRTDLYALGSVLYAMLAGRAPFTGKKLTEVIESLQRERPVPLDLVQPDVPEELVELIHHLLEKDPANRPPTALAVMNRLKSMRAGLERAQTVIVDESKTQIGPRIARDPDTSLTDDPGSATNAVDGKNPAPNPSEDQTRVRRPGDPDVQDESFEVPGNPPGQSTADTVGKSERTALPDGSVPNEEDKKSKTHFRTVDDSKLHESHDTTPHHSAVEYGSQWLGIALMVIVLLGGAGLFVYSMRPPNRGELFDAAMQGDTGAMQAFLKNFPEDLEATTVLDRKNTVELNGVLKRFRTHLRLNVSPLDASEETFLHAMEARDTNPEVSSARIEDWLAVYESQESTPEMKKLIDLATHEVERLRERPTPPQDDERLAKLLDQIQTAVETADPAVIHKQLDGIISTFGDTDWAQPAVKRAREELARLVSPGGSTGTQPSPPTEPSTNSLTTQDEPE